MSSQIVKRKSTTTMVSSKEELEQCNNLLIGKVDKKDGGNLSTGKKDNGQRRNYSLLSYDELPEYMKDNKYILNHYRVDWTFREAFFSLFSWHNESLNVWTHLLGFLLFLALTIANSIHLSQVADFIMIFTKNYPSIGGENFSSLGLAKLIDQQEVNMDITSWPFFVFLGGSMFCLLCSSIYHLFCCHSNHLIHLFLLQLDYVGIAVLIITAAFPPIYYIFQCSPYWQLAYLIGITVMGICTIITLLNPKFSTMKYRSFRVGLFMSLALFGIMAGVHALVVNWNDPRKNSILVYESVMVVSAIIGTVVFLCRIPERWMPGWFDLTGHSHQIFHVSVMVSVFAHYGAAKLFLEYHGKLGCQ